MVWLTGDEPDFALPFWGIGSVCFHVGRYDLALRCFKFVLAHHVRTLGPDHVETAAAMINFGCALDLFGKHDFALFEYRRAERILVARLGRRHPRTCTASRNIDRCRRRAHAIRRGTRPVGLRLRRESDRLIPGGSFFIKGAQAPAAGGGKKKKKGKKGKKKKGKKKKKKK